MSGISDAELLLEYKDRKDMLKEITRLKKALEIANEAIGFYGNKENWGYSGVPKNRAHLAGIIVDNDCGMDLDKYKFMGGKRAREAQKQIKEIVEGK